MLLVICHSISLWGLSLIAHPSLQCLCIQLHSMLESVNMCTMCDIALLLCSLEGHRRGQDEGLQG